MKSRSIIKLAAVGALALGVAFGGTSANAQVNFEAGTPQTLNITANVDNTITATVVEPNLGNLGVVASDTPGEQAILALLPAGTFNTAAAVDGSSRILTGGGHVAGSVTIAAGDAFPTTPVYVTYSNPQNLVCTTAPCDPLTAPALLLREVRDNLTGTGACGALTAGILDVVTPANTVQGCGITAANGSLAFNIGVTIATVDGVTPRPVYPTSAYAGSVDLIVEY